jgi:hypothetical protein
MWPMRAGGAFFSLPRNSSRIIISVLRDDHAAGVAKTVPPLPWVLNWVLGWVALRGKSEGEGKSDGGCDGCGNLKFEILGNGNFGGNGKGGWNAEDFESRSA